MSAGHESSLERDWLMVLDFDWRVRRIVEQPYTLRPTINGRRTRYTPDVLADFDDGGNAWTVVYEVKSIDEIREDWQLLRPRFKAALHDCRVRGWKFKLITERDLDTPYVNNLRFLRRYRHLPANPMHTQAIWLALTALGPTTPRALMEATWRDEDRRLAAIPYLWEMIGQRKIATVLADPLKMTSLIWMP